MPVIVPSTPGLRSAAVLLLILALAACGQGHGEGGRASAVRGAPAQPAPAAAAGPHSWLYRRDGAYAYEAEATPGKAAPAVQMYRYLGQRDGVFTLQVGGETATCANPCQVITLHSGVFHIERLDFDPDSLIGAAFTDAFDGQLEVYDPAKQAGR